MESRRNHAGSAPHDRSLCDRKTLHCHQGSGTKIPSHRVHFAMQRSVANTTVGARSRKLGHQRRYPSGPQKYAVDVRRVGEVPSVWMRRLHRFKTFSCLCANNSLTGVRFECSRLRTMLARTRPTTRTNSTSVRNLPAIIAFFLLVAVL